MRRLSLDHLTVFSLTPPQQIALAARLGCDAVSIRVQPMPQDEIPSLDMIGDTPMRRETKRLSRDLGVDIHLVEVFMVFGRTEIESYRPALESAAELGARVANVGCMDRDRNRFHQKFAQFCELAAEYGIKTSVEPFGAGPMFHASEAREAVDQCGRADAGIMTDILHMVRSGDSPADLSRFEPSRILYAQLSDGPLQLPADHQVIDEAMYDRHLPGDGEFPLADFIRAIPENVPLGLEVPMRRLKQAGVSAEDRAAMVVKAARALLNQS
jgi:sugar phosphate isomerase/epimerase